jgi:hypothetical protein
MQVAPGARVAGLDELVTTGHVVELPRLKFVEMLGLLPEAGVGKMSMPVPLFSIVIVCGLSLLVEPTGVDTKLKVGTEAAPTS